MLLLATRIRSTATAVIQGQASTRPRLRLRALQKNLETAHWSSGNFRNVHSKLFGSDPKFTIEVKSTLT